MELLCCFVGLYKVYALKTGNTYTITKMKNIHLQMKAKNRTLLNRSHTMNIAKNKMGLSHCYEENILSIQNQAQPRPPSKRCCLLETLVVCRCTVDFSTNFSLQSVDYSLLICLSINMVYFIGMKRCSFYFFSYISPTHVIRCKSLKGNSTESAAKFD